MAFEQTQTPPTVRVAAIQAEGCYFDLPAAVEKTYRFIEEAASKGCDLIAFPELWIPMYPGWIWCVPYPLRTATPVDFNMVTEYMKSSLRRDSPETNTIRQCASSNNIAVALGYSENDNHPLYLS
ncbi:Nitrilase/cyanide hydratase and apolipo protein N-acyltransferase [Aspergillus ruber CBS 135680]|uniref:nitrilase n=1 Tax=Aspergillus ruber (strain CBS 135680) TaxID=1388766 RepID=A0A017S607_ASPRC|nr:Nitrilase/cyanide hydratase and apolipo protein N-acyltransferase [Aspergillus ruber CBS 135680]EYE92296.1 Nitrilase/cyanide hydratase and apolipo protein N-acyltransferase [Aspergillus ruber CBS 135680]